MVKFYRYIFNWVFQFYENKRIVINMAVEGLVWIKSLIKHEIHRFHEHVDVYFKCWEGWTAKILGGGRLPCGGGGNLLAFLLEILLIME